MSKKDYTELFPRQANSTEYFISAELLYAEYKKRFKNSKPFDIATFIANPIVVLYALSIELILKAVLLSEKASNKYQKTHNIKNLFNAVDNVEYKNFVRNSFKNQNFEANLEKFSNAFINIRYLWERLDTEGSVELSSSSDIEYIRKLAHKVVEGFVIIKATYAENSKFASYV